MLTGRSPVDHWPKLSTSRKEDVCRCSIVKQYLPASTPASVEFHGPENHHSWCSHGTCSWNHRAQSQSLTQLAIAKGQVL